MTRHIFFLHFFEQIPFLAGLLIVSPLLSLMMSSYLERHYLLNKIGIQILGQYIYQTVLLACGIFLLYQLLIVFFSHQKKS